MEVERNGSGREESMYKDPVFGKNLVPLKTPEDQDG